jgi:hypothetical protein
MIVVRTTGEYFLRGTAFPHLIWTGDVNRATDYPDCATARSALESAKKFTKRAAWKTAEILDITVLVTTEIKSPADLAAALDTAGAA